MRNLGAMRRLGLTILAAAAVGATPVKADEWHQPGEPGRWVPGTPYTASQYVSDWSGFYVGGKLGGAWSDIHWTESFAEFGTEGGSFSPSSFAGGVFGGGNLQMGNWIFGLEVSFIGMGLSQSVSPLPTDTLKTQIDWLLVIEPRLGYAWDRHMVYVKGGWVGGDAKFSGSGVPTNNAPGIATFSKTDFVDGWTIGGGIEYAWLPSVIVGIDYQYIDLDLSTAAACDLCLIGIPIGEPAELAGGATINQVMLRASYLFRGED